jgi:SAM-dependent methyltransferase
MTQTIYRWLISTGIYPRQILSFFPGLILFFKDYFALVSKGNKDFKVKLNYPCLHDRYDSSGSARGHYFHQDLYVAQQVFKNNPEKHIDIASRVDGFVAHVASFRDIEVFDIRHLEPMNNGIEFKQMDLMNPPTEYFNYADSLSCLHALEHFGLGRYGDRIDFDGYIDGFKNISKIIKPGGTFFLSVPIGEQRIEFNAHRVFSIETIIKLYNEEFELSEFSYIDDQDKFLKNVSINENTINDCNKLRYGCGIFILTKKK